MRTLILVAALTALAACSQKPEETKETAAPATAPTPAPVASDSATKPGSYDVKMADGSAATTVINADGTYVDTDAKGGTAKGRFAVKDGKDCFDPDGDEGETCWTVSAAGADGSFTATDPKGTTVTVSPKKN
ncbi:hypothetical protein EAO27_05875 [Sphingopyxis sp. YF1]|jgi:hypothetical protein|uniref:hypothetical protein n=1 Tax=Sphingopyxis sp. YF1 TaxID=2482763 RepID=UPI001F60672B|nr:hypothetical protein [Sphingopyxis sp. YF1]UNU42287.1 hypothetical protein EAO27_05875 [Sphingopyxis sp. YF1]